MINRIHIYTVYYWGLYTISEIPKNILVQKPFHTQLFTQFISGGNIQYLRYLKTSMYKNLFIHSKKIGFVMSGHLWLSRHKIWPTNQRGKFNKQVELSNQYQQYGGLLKHIFSWIGNFNIELWALCESCPTMTKW